MAILNGLYLHVTDETVIEEMEITAHPVEIGEPTTDTARPKQTIVTLKGKLVDYQTGSGGTMYAIQVYEELDKLRRNRSVIKYAGRQAFADLCIRVLETSRQNTTSGGADFTLELVGLSNAHNSYTPSATVTAQQVEAAIQTPTIVVGSIVVFKGGSVYVSSDAPKAASTRNRSTCKCTKINTKDYAIHQYHLISADGGNVYGWVDKANIEGVEPTITNGKTNAGTSQASTTETYIVKSGDTVSKIASTKRTTVAQIMKDNPNAFSVANDARTLQVGAKLIIKTSS